MSERIYAKYFIETSHNLERAAAVMAGEQSAGTFVKVPGESPELLEKYGATVENILPLEIVDSPSLPCYQKAKGSQAGTTIQRAQVTLSFPYETVGTSLTTLYTVVSGNLFELAQFSALRLIDITIPAVFAQKYPMPQFGIAGTRKLAGVYARPLIGTIIKPSVGLSPQATADIIKDLCEAGLDFVKDDELQTDSPHSSLRERVQAVMAVVNDHAQKTGKKVMVGFNITGDLDDMFRAHDFVLEQGGTCVMVNMLAVGLTGLIALRKHSQLPIHGHRAGWGLYSRSPHIGISYTVFQKFMRLAGIDHLHVNGLRNKFCESDESVLASAQACLTPLFGDDTAMPVFSSGQSAEQVEDTYAALKSADLMYLAGGGILAHKSGAAAGVRSLQQAWAAAMQGIPVAAYAETHAELKQALESFRA
jgi:ribulose-bisphosphate carboxylase large chain